MQQSHSRTLMSFHEEVCRLTARLCKVANNTLLLKAVAIASSKMDQISHDASHRPNLFILAIQSLFERPGDF